MDAPYKATMTSTVVAEGLTYLQRRLTLRPQFGSILGGASQPPRGKVSMLVSYHDVQGSYPYRIHILLMDLPFLPTFLLLALLFANEDPTKCYGIYFLEHHLPPRNSLHNNRYWQ